MIKQLKRFIPKSIKQWLVLKLTKIQSPVLGVGEDIRIVGHAAISISQKRALVAYITAPFRLGPDDPRNLEFSNIGIGRSIVRALNELDYVVDVVEYSDKRFMPRNDYDLFIGHTGRNFQRIAGRLKPGTVKIYFSSGPYWRFWNEQEVKRIESLRQRRQVKYPFERIIKESEEWANENADAIICLGNDYARQSYSRFPKVFNLNNASYYDDRYDWTKKDFTSARKNFLFFSGPGNVHKGLDLLLEAFIGLGAHLYICQRINPDFLKIYRNELTVAPNIHLVGVIPMRSRQFYELVDRCAFIINPSCAEGQPGGVVECMHQGLIPVVSRETNIDTGDYGITFQDCSVGEIVETVRDLSGRSPEWCAEMSRKTRRVAVSEFSASLFLRNIKDIIRSRVAGIISGPLEPERDGWNTWKG
ncbi:MAG: glycosyltransferase [Candidatus Omnitrophica bacterium]|nr:glycosyltransferase [Candidatus Omnitrophota bacterium]